MARKKQAPGFNEAQAPFAAAASSLLPVFRAYGFRCAFTGADLTAEVDADPNGTVVRLDGASNAPQSVIPACLDAIHAFERFHLTIGTRYEFLVAKDVIDPEFEERLLAIGRLNLPKPAAFYPNADLLRRHCLSFVEGATGP